MRHCRHDHSSTAPVKLLVEAFIKWNMQRLRRSSTSSTSVIAPSCSCQDILVEL